MTAQPSCITRECNDCRFSPSLVLLMLYPTKQATHHMKQL